jgi:hypothetical protein
MIKSHARIVLFISLSGHPIASLLDPLDSAARRAYAIAY